MTEYAARPPGVRIGGIWRKPTRLDRAKAALFGWHKVYGGTVHFDGTITVNREYFPPAWWVWLRRRSWK
jgi:hypothetical protein